MKNKSSKPGCLLLFLIITIVYIGTVAGLWINSATWCFADIGFINSLIVGTPISFILSGVAIVIFFVSRNFIPVDKWGTPKAVKIILAPAVIYLIVSLTVSAVNGTASGRFSSHVRVKPDNVHNIRVAGISAFLSTRWLFQFDADTNVIRQIVFRHKLEECEPFNLKSMIQNGFLTKKIKWGSDIFEVKDGMFYKRKTENLDSVSGTYLMYDSKTSRAWFFKMYQN